MGFGGQRSYFAEFSHICSFTGYPLEAKKKIHQRTGHVAYQIEGNGACSIMVANILPVDTPSTPGKGQKDKHFFLKVVMLHIKKVMEYRAPRKRIFCLYSYTRSLRWGQKVKICCCFSKK